MGTLDRVIRDACADVERERSPPVDAAERARIDAAVNAAMATMRQEQIDASWREAALFAKTGKRAAKPDPSWAEAAAKVNERRRS